ncbi:MAG: sensor histidine kinase, partial [Promethearchaeota archaeon]
KIGLDSEIFIYADPVRIKEIFSNLISNALKYTIKGWIKIICQENDKDWIFKIQDTGIGIAEKDHALIFKEFKRVDSPYVKSVQGTGLGLSLIKRLIHLHRGEIWFESELDKGSTFIFNIPKEKTDIITKTKADNEN